MTRLDTLGLILAVVLVAAGYLVGFVTGRWWAVLVAVALGLHVTAVTSFEAPIALGLFYGVFAAIGIAVGVVARRRGMPQQRLRAGPDKRNGPH